MQVDHIDENTIRVKISKDELARRGVKVLDMLNDRSKIQNFFYSILAEVDTDHTFTQNVPVSFQVMPNNGGLDLLITKVKNGHVQNMGRRMQKAGAFNGLNGSGQREANSLSAANQTVDNGRQQCYLFSNLEAVIELADNLRVHDLASSLYYYKEQYFMILSFLDNDYTELQPRDAWSIANEFGIKINQNEMKTIKETGQCLFGQNALANVRYYFVNKK